MRGLAAYDGAPVDQLRCATRRALSNLVELAIEEQVELVLLAGDLFDGDWRHYGTGTFFVKEMSRLREAGIEVVSIAGNHDAESKLTKTMRLPGNVHVLSTRKPETKTFEGLGVAVHGQGYPTPAVLDDLSAAYPTPLPDMLNIGVLHTSLDGRPGHAHYAPCTVERLAERGYVYWALGHVHRREIMSTEPAIVFAGNLQGRGLRETGPKGATLAELAPDGSLSFEHHDLDCVRWEVVEVDVEGASNRDEVCERVGGDVREVARAAGDRLLAARVVLRGTTETHQWLAADDERLRYEIIAATADLAGEQVWIEGVRLATAPPRPLAESGDDAVGELLRELERLGADEAAMTELTRDVLSPLTASLPQAILEEWDPLDASVLRELMCDVERSLPVALLKRGES